MRFPFSHLRRPFPNSWIGNSLYLLAALGLILSGCRPGGAGARAPSADRGFYAAQKSHAGTHVCNGDQYFTVPVTAWQVHGDWVLFTLYYGSWSFPLQFEHSDRTELLNTAHLSEKNSKWRHTFSPWVICYPPQQNGDQEFILNWETYKVNYTRTLDHGKTVFRPLDPRFLPKMTQSKMNSNPVISCNGETEIIPAPAGVRLESPDHTVYVFDALEVYRGNCDGYLRFDLSEIDTRSGGKLICNRSGTDESRIDSVTDETGKGLSFHYNAKGLLDSVKDPYGNTHTFTYTAVPDENHVPRSKLTKIDITGAPSRRRYNWSFDYGDPKDLTRSYGGAYTGDLVVHKEDQFGEKTDYDYLPVHLSGKPPHVKRSDEKSWSGRLDRIRWIETRNGASVPQ